MIANRSALNPFVDHKHHVPYAKFDLYESYGMSNEIPSYVSHAITSLNSSKRHMPIKILLMEALAKGTMSKKRILKKTFTYSDSEPIDKFLAFTTSKFTWIYMKKATTTDALSLTSAMIALIRQRLLNAMSCLTLSRP